MTFFHATGGMLSVAAPAVPAPTPRGAERTAGTGADTPAATTAGQSRDATSTATASTTNP